MPTRRPPSLRISSFTALIAVVALALGLTFLHGNSPRNTASASASASPVSSKETPEQVYSSTHAGVVKISTGSGLGSGIVLDTNGDILTNEHVVDGANRVTVAFDSKVTRGATVLGSDPSSDLAVVKVNPSGLTLHPLTLADSSTVRVGDTVYAIGNPFGYTNSFSEGIVSGLDRSMTAPNGFTIAHAIQTDAAINPGNSGGPLLNANGQVVGINAQIASSGSTASGQGQNNGVGFAISIDTAKPVIQQLEKSGHVSHAYLGVATADAPSQNGAVVETVQAGTPADQAGIQQGDVIRSIDGEAVSGSEDVASAIAAHQAGDKVQIGLDRNGSSHTVTVTLAEQPTQAPQG